MGAFTYIETDTGTNVDISAATAVGAYTSTGDKLIMVDVSIDAVAGNGDYVMYVTRKIGGSGSAYRILPQTTMTAASGLTAISGQSGWITVRNGDVLTCYVDGLAGDTSTPDWSTRWFELAGVTAASIADAVLDEATADHTSAGSLSKAVADILTDTGTTLDGKIDTIDANVDSILADTGTDGVVIAGAQTVATVTNLTNLPAAPTDWLTAAAVKADAVTKLQANLALEATLTAIKGAGWDTQTLAAIDVLIDAIKAKTDTITAAPTVDAIADGVWDEAIAAHTTATTFGGKNQKVVPSETINDYKADVSALTNVKLAADQSGVTIPAVTTVTNLTNAPTNGDLTATMKSSVTTAASSATPALSSAGVDAILDEVVVGSYTMRQLLKVLASKMVGKATGGGTTTITYRGVDDSSNVVVETVDDDGNRSAVTLTV